MVAHSNASISLPLPGGLASDRSPDVIVNLFAPDVIFENPATEGRLIPGLQWRTPPQP